MTAGDPARDVIAQRLQTWFGHEAPARTDELLHDLAAGDWVFVERPRYDSLIRMQDALLSLMGAELVGAHQELAWLDAEQRLHAHFGDDVLAEAHSALQALVAQPPPSHPVMVPRGENAQDRAFREQLSDQLTELQAQRDALARAVLRPHCPLGCVEHREHYFVIEVEIGPLPEPVRSMVDTDLAKLFEAIADMAMSKRDDVNMSAAVLSDVAIGLTDSSLYDCP